MFADAELLNSHQITIGDRSLMMVKWNTSPEKTCKTRVKIDEIVNYTKSLVASS